MSTIRFSRACYRAAIALHLLKSAVRDKWSVGLNLNRKSKEGKSEGEHLVAGSVMVLKINLTGKAANHAPYGLHRDRQTHGKLRL